MPGRGRRAEVGDVVDLVLVQADPPHQVDLDLVARRDAADEVGAASARSAGRPRGSAGCCRRGASTRRPGTCRGSRARAPRRRWPTPPTPARTRRSGSTPNTVAPRRGRVRHRLAARVGHRGAPQRGHRHGGVVDDPVDDHLGDVVVDGHRIGGDLGDAPGQLLLAGRCVRGGADTDVVGPQCGSRLAGLRRVRNIAAATDGRLVQVCEEPNVLLRRLRISERRGWP